MDILKNKGRTTRLLLLLEMVTNLPRDQRSLAESVGITPQAVSEYMSRMKMEGLAETLKEGPRATVRGVDMLQSDLLRLKEMVDSSISKLEIIRSTDAVAGEHIERGETGHLTMKDGLLYAFKGEGGSTGTADNDAGPGEMLSVSDLSGVMEMEKGTLRLMEVVPVRRGGGGDRIDPDELIRMSGVGDRSHRIAALDLESAAFLMRSKIPYHLELPSAEYVLEPLDRGLDVIALGTPYAISTVLRKMDELKREVNVERFGKGGGSRG